MRKLLPSQCQHYFLELAHQRGGTMLKQCRPRNPEPGEGTKVLAQEYVPANSLYYI